MPVMLCRRQRLDAESSANHGLLKAAQREAERQSQGAPLLTLQGTRILGDGDREDGFNSGTIIVK
jgi:hypothetical protein